MLRAVIIGSLLAPLAFAAQAVEGHIVNALTGVDIPAATVNLVAAGTVAYSAVTDDRGHFRIPAVKPGLYTANYTARGFTPIPNFAIDENFERECGHCFLKERGGEPFQINDDIVPPHLEVKLSPLAGISGRVLDESGLPVPHARVQFHWGENWLCSIPSCLGVFHSVDTDENGEYRITGLDLPGAWLLSAIPPSQELREGRENSDLARVQTFYPGVIDPRLAVRVMLRAGSDIPNLDIRLAAVPVHQVRGVVVDTHGNPVSGAAVTLTRGVEFPAMTRVTKTGGRFEFPAAAQGEWRISAKVDQAGPELWTSRSIYVKSDDLDDVELRPAAPFAMEGKIILETPEGTPVPKPPTVTMAFNNAALGLPGSPAATFLTGAPDTRGDFHVGNIYSAGYQILPGPAPPQYYLDSIRLGGRDALEADTELTSAASPLVITYRYGGGNVRGTVENCAAGTVRLLPRDKTFWRPGFVLFAPCDSNDRYELTSVRPGEYYAIAVAGNSPASWYATTWSDDVLLPNAVAISVRDGQNSTADLRAVRQ
jgi:hypothetical protein